ncbi:UBP1-associated protein 2C [Malania oleifera]|uniref:UBP1-associated protein 2C n=1 Tax=Malania oleifera TaxID=397392 RepID=UPI0025AE1FFA|nr:UBP1-associated protein 2C [Malania oleifera]XP_057952356.1 UBP1-associated protein 2C [Malania oleifera]XP_057952364.1 UBP1-associated protein 2C [Malania oleifera]
MDPAKKRKIDENGVAATDVDAGSSLTLEDARKIIEPFTHEQLIEIVQNAAVRHLDVLDAVRSIADRDPTQRKLFIRGLGWDTTTENLRNLFSTYGDLEEAVVILDKVTGKSKGYGFVTFKHVDGALLALKEPSKKIDGRMTVTQLAVLGNSGSNANPTAIDVSMRKIYVANVPTDMPADRLLAHFSSYGEIEEGPLGFDKQTGKSRGFALFVYKTAEAARASLVDPAKTIDGHQLMCKLAIEGKKGKPGMPGGVQGPAGGEAHGDGLGLPPTSMPGSLGSQYGGPGGPGGISSYGGFSGGPPPLGHHHGLNSSLPSSLGGPGLSSVGGQVPASYGSGMGGPYGASQYGGPTATGYGGLGGAGSGLGGGLGGAGGGLGGAGGGLGGAGGGSSMYGRLPPNTAGMPSSGGYPESGHYSLSSSGYPSQHHQATGTSPVPRVAPGGMYQGMPPYY